MSLDRKSFSRVSIQLADHVSSHAAHMKYSAVFGGLKNKFKIPGRTQVIWLAGCSEHASPAQHRPDR